jgi:hypothetical protein
MASMAALVRRVFEIGQNAVGVFFEGAPLT